MNDGRQRLRYHHQGFPEHGRRRGGRGGRMRRGDIRTALLAVLAEGPGHGYDLMQALEDKTEGTWRPSPGSVYPTLQLLEDEGLVTSSERDGKRVYDITEGGRAEADRRIEEAGGTPWELAGHGGGKPAGDLRTAMVQLVVACKQIATTGNASQLERAAEVARDARKRLYAILAED